MISLVYGKVTGIKPPRVSVKLTGIEGDAELECMTLQLGGQSSGQRQWIAPLKDDVVAVLFDDEKPENSLILGGVYSDKQGVPTGDGIAVQTKTVHVEASGDIEAQAQRVKLGKDLSLVQKVARADHVNSELSEIQSALEQIVTAFNTHVHASSGATPTPTTFNSYIAGNTDARSVFAD